MTRLRRNARAVPAALVLALVAGVPASGEIYRWTDAAGQIHFTERIENVPKSQRAAARRAAGQPAAAQVNTYSGAGEPGASVPRRAAPSRGGVIEIPFVKVGTLMRVEALVNDVGRVPFLIDTGASGVSLPSVYANQLGIHVASDGPHVAVSTANGVVARALVTLDSVQVSGARVEHLVATVNPDMEIGLLGGTFFNNYVYSVDAARGVITLQPNEQIRAGVGADEWRARFRTFVDPIERLDAYLRDNPNLPPRERARLGAHRAELEASLGELDHQADRHGVPQKWRR
jgi:clan AA aspartic protease (TIGR02281 family)